jgi:hypothetical protein
VAPIAAEYVPAPQALHADAPAAANEPAPQALHADAPAAANVPAPHSEQLLELDEPVTAEALPAPQSVHTCSAFQKALKPSKPLRDKSDLNVTKRLADENVCELQNASLSAQFPDILRSRVGELQLASAQLNTETKS